MVYRTKWVAVWSDWRESLVPPPLRGLMRTRGIVVTALAFGFMYFPVTSLGAPDPTANVVQLRKDCAEGGVTKPNCFTSMISVTDWIKLTRRPSAVNPLLVEIGPGTFGRFTCRNGGYTTLRGSGRQNTVITNGEEFNNAFDAINCTQLDLSELSIVGTKNALHTMDWSGGGTSTWSNVDVVGNSYGWWDTGGIHFWFGSRITNKAGFSVSRAYQTTAGESWFFGSELKAEASTRESASDVTALGVNGGEVHVYGGVIRAVAPLGSVGTLGSFEGIKAIKASGSSAEVHIHGTGIDVISSAADEIAALFAENGARIHADGTAYNLATGPGGTVFRIINSGGHVHAPYTWQHIPDYPLRSITGADTTMEIVGSDINLLIYNSQCSGAGGPWYNVALRSCR